MATFDVLRSKLRARVLNASSSNYYEDADLLGILDDASRELAAAFRFPRAVTSAIPLPVGAVAVPSLPTTLVDVETVNVGGLAVPKRSYAYVKMMQQLPQAKWPRGYFFDTHYGAGATLMVGAPSLGGISAVVEYVDDPYGGATVVAGTEVWNGAHENFHELVLLRGAVKAFEMTFEMEDSSYYLQRYGMVLQEFANFLKMPVPARLQSAASGAQG